MSKFCGICDLNIGDKTWDDHKQSSLHQKNVSQKENSVCLEKKNGWDPHVSRNDLITSFSKYGPIIKITMRTKIFPHVGHATIEFSRKEIVAKVLELHYCRIHGYFVKVSRCETAREREARSEREQAEARVQEAKDHKYREDLFKSVKLGNTTGDQIRQLAFMHNMDLAMASKQLQNDVLAALQPYLPDVFVYIVGSCATGLCVRGSDINIEVVLKYAKKPVWTKKPPPPLPSAIFKSTNLRVDGQGLLDPTSVLYNDRKNNNEFLWLVYEVLARSPLAEHMVDFQMYADEDEEYEKRGRLIFTDKRNNVPCRITVKLGESYNQHIAHTIHTLVGLDERVRPLYIAVRFWARQVGVYSSFSSYGVFLLLYLYLQNTKPPILPSVDTLLNMQAPERVMQTKEGANVGIFDDKAVIQQQCLTPKNLQTMAELLQGFFKYYAKFEMSNRVLCPSSGRSYNMLKFRNMMKVVDGLKKFNLNDRCFHIQDLFRKHRNIVIPTAYINKHQISLEFLRATTIVRDKVDESWHLLSVFPMKPITAILDSILQRAPVVIPFDAVLLPDGFLSYSSYSEAERHWYQWIVELTMKVLHVLRIEYTLEGDFGEEDVAEGKRRLAQELDGNKRLCTEADRLIHTADRDAAMDFKTCFEPDRAVVQETRLRCTDTRELWRHRSSVSSKTRGRFSKEEQITQELLDKPSVAPHQFILVMQHVKTANESQVEMGAEAIGDDNFRILTFMNFFQDYVMHLVCKQVGLDITLLAAKFRN